jgi:hypothetical protein
MHLKIKLHLSSSAQPGKKREALTQALASHTFARSEHLKCFNLFLTDASCFVSLPGTHYDLEYGAGAACFG